MPSREQGDCRLPYAGDQGELISHPAVHRCKHAVPFLWRFHALHHSDPDVDVTTTVRVHPIEYLLGSGIFWLTVILLGIPATVGLTYGLAVLAIEAVQHGNIRLPQRLDRSLSWVVQRAWKISRMEIKKLPSVNDVDAGDDDEGG